MFSTRTLTSKFFDYFIIIIIGKFFAPSLADSFFIGISSGFKDSSQWSGRSL